MGEFRLQVAFRPTRASPLRNDPGHKLIRRLSQHEALTIDAFELLKVVGKGSFGKVRPSFPHFTPRSPSPLQVMQVRKKDTGRIYALKTIRKAHIVNRSEVTHTLAERTVLARVSSPFIVPLKFSFQSPEKLYLVLAYV